MSGRIVIRLMDLANMTPEQIKNIVWNRVVIIVTNGWNMSALNSKQLQALNIAKEIIVEDR